MRTIFSKQLVNFAKILENFRDFWNFWENFRTNYEEICELFLIFKIFSNKLLNYYIFVKILGGPGAPKYRV